MVWPIIGRIVIAAGGAALKSLKKAKRAPKRSQAKEVCKKCKDPRCVVLYAEIEQFMEQVWRRAKELNYDSGGLPQTPPSTPDPKYGNRSIQGEQHAFKSDQQGLKNRLEELNKRGCPAPPKNAWALANLPPGSKANPIKPPDLPF